MARQVGNGSSGLNRHYPEKSQEMVDNSVKKNELNNEKAAGKSWSFRRVKNIGAEIGRFVGNFIKKRIQTDFKNHNASGKENVAISTRPVIVINGNTSNVKEEARQSRSLDSSKLNQSPSENGPDSAFPMASDGVDDRQNHEQIGVAGHAENFVPVGDGYIGKLTNKNEVEIYRDRDRLKLDSIIPRSKQLEDLNRIERENLLSIEVRAAQSDNMEVIIPEMLGSNIPGEQKIEMDVKIGFRTASRAQLKKDKHHSLRSKLLKHTVIDTVLGSTFRGFRVAGLGGRGFPVKSGRLVIGLKSESCIKSVVKQAGTYNREAMIKQLEHIKNTLDNAPVAFVGMSVFFSVDTLNPDNTVVKLIDFSHPLYEGESDYLDIKRDTIKGMSRLIHCIESH